MPLRHGKRIEIPFVYEFIWMSVPWITTVSVGLGGQHDLGRRREVQGDRRWQRICLGALYRLHRTRDDADESLILDESSAYELLLSAIFVWVILLMLIKVKTLHDFEIEPAGVLDHGADADRRLHHLVRRHHLIRFDR